MTTEILKWEQSEARETKGITFRCKFCRKTKPLDEMRALARFFPPIVATGNNDKLEGFLTMAISSKNRK